MIRKFSIPIIISGFCLNFAIAKESDVLIRLPLRVHIVTGVEMVRETKAPDGTPVETVMNMPVKEADMRTIIAQVNEIWAPAQIFWETDPKQGGGGVLTEQAGGGKLSKAVLHELADKVTARNREDGGDSMKAVFPALADPKNNDDLFPERNRGVEQASFYHLYVFPYVGQTLQGTAHCPGKFAIVGAFSDKKPNKPGFPKPRPFLVPKNSGAALSSENFPAEGALSATIAHELGHNLGLVHSNEGMQDNLMKGHVKLRLSQKQILAARKQAMIGPILKK